MPAATTDPHRRCARPLVAVLAACSLLAAATIAAPAAAASGPANSQASEVARLINAERSKLGLSTLRTDSFLAGKARDGSIACPNSPSRVMQGRAKDLALYG